MEVEVKTDGKSLKLAAIQHLKEYAGLFKKKYTLLKICFTKTSDAKSMSCVQMERKSLKVLISMI
jgi:hypothetical protein